MAQTLMVPATAVAVFLAELTPMSGWEIPYDQKEKVRVWLTEELALYVGATALPSGKALNDGSETKPFSMEELWALLHLVIQFLCWKEETQLRINMDS